ncbi:uncharacterized protein BKA55DRAFT_595586 [Fusarium redolens]|uniref:Peptidase S1 domain-containing protein n=1 Tax=Fusarium redolens TaxID=48865 RepID=A0A9P9GS69_FUSRE|nr:uncharacterized protein BKA55DRAFT_595586 [Fusarium redolens]KAH7244480.1 hypothetical protein BKA55DRAFT_595586 [Fusarium redolens]
MVTFNLFKISILVLGNRVFATPVPDDNTIHARSPRPPPPVPPHIIPAPLAPPATTANQLVVETHPPRGIQVGPIPRVHLVPRHQLDSFAGKPVPPHRPRQRRNLPDSGDIPEFRNMPDFSKLPGFIKDDRHIWDNKHYPAYSFGRILLGANSFANSNPRSCSGSLVGPRHVLIARHCLGEKVADSIQFESNFFEGPRGGSSCIYENTIYTLERLGYLILADRMGEKHGYLGVKDFDTKTLMNKQLFSHVGFPNKFPYDKGKPLRQDGISVEKCYISCDIYGVVSSRHMDLAKSMNPPDKCVFVSSTKFITAVAMARQQFP